jgi:EAL domain-containing protein (putative c-di-GMP-specific phosphodiesterase class I)/DNA-binding response OmpR family regulator
MTPRPQEGPPVLVVDDDDASRNLVAFALRRAGLEVLEAPDGPAALEIVRTTPIGLVVLDMVMPGMYGIEVVQALRSRTESATLPVLLMTGSGDQNSVIQGLAAGADDFLAKPVRLDELVARVNAHLRRQCAWSGVLEERSAQLGRQRALIAETLRGLRPADTLEATAQVICRQVLSLSEVAAAQLLIFELDGRAMTVGFAIAGQPDPPLRRLPFDRSQQLRARAAQGPWIESWSARPEDKNFGELTGLGNHLIACAPVHSQQELIGLLVMDGAQSVDEAQFTDSLAALAEFANLASALIGRDVAQRTQARRAREQIRGIIDGKGFKPVFQPIVELKTGKAIGYEALTRFPDGVDPDAVFGQATAVGLGLELEGATLEAAVSAAKDLPRAAWLSLNVSPDLIFAYQPLQTLVSATQRGVVLEVTEQTEIADYEAFRAAVADLGPKPKLSVDDAGAGFASFRHILELRPAYIKLDRSLIADLESDQARQAMIVGLRHFARSVGAKIIAEGVETAAEVEILRTLGLTLGQGYLLGRPMPAAESESSGPVP